MSAPGPEPAPPPAAEARELADELRPGTATDDERHLPRWVWSAVVLFWGGFLATYVLRNLWSKLSALLILLLISLFLALAIEPGVNRLARRGWRRGTATALILLGVLAAFVGFIVAIGALVGSQIADLLSNSEKYITDTVRFLNDTFGFNFDAQQVIDSFNDPTGPVQRFIANQQDNAVRLSVAALGGLLQLFSVLLFSFYLIADGPKMRRAICSRLSAARQERVLSTWELAANKTGGYLYSRALLALISAVFHWIVFQSLGTAAPVALALWVGIVSQFLPVVGTYLAGILPVLLTFLDSPLKAVIVVIAIVVYQQIENYVFSPRITARTMELHPAIAFGSALGGAAVLGAVGAVLALPAAAMATALISEAGDRHKVVRNELTEVRHHRVWKRWARMSKRAEEAADGDETPEAADERADAAAGVASAAAHAADRAAVTARDAAHSAGNAATMADDAADVADGAARGGTGATDAPARAGHAAAMASSAVDTADEAADRAVGAADAADAAASRARQAREGSS